MTDELQMEDVTPEREALFEDIEAAINRSVLPWPDTLAILANMLGKLIAAVPSEDAGLAREVASTNILHGIQVESGITVTPPTHDA